MLSSGNSAFLAEPQSPQGIAPLRFIEAKPRKLRWYLLQRLFFARDRAGADPEYFGTI